MPTHSAQEAAELAQQRYRSGDLTGACEAFERAGEAYLQAGDTLGAAEMKNNQAVALLRARQAERALQAVSGTQAVFAAAGDARREGMAWANQASALQALHRPKDAIEAYRKAADALERAGEGDLRAEVMQLLAVLFLRRFKLFDSVLSLQSGLLGVKNPTARQRLMKKLLFIRF